MVSQIEGDGTGEDDWLPHLLKLPSWQLGPVPDRTVVLAPHPDDEVLGVGGLMSLLQAAGSRLEVVAVTDGEASHPGGSLSTAALADVRRAETNRALAALGLQATVTHLELPDGGAGGLEEPVLEALSLSPGDLLVATWESDGHPDHEAVGRAAQRAAAHVGARLLSYPIWAWHWDSPSRGRLPLRQAERVELPLVVQRAKASAVRAFVSQTTAIGPRPEDHPVLSAAVLARFARPFEVVLR